MMLRNSAFVLLTMFIASANAADIGTCPLTAPYSPEALNSMVDCSDAGGFVSCQYNAADGGGINSFGFFWDCRCAGDGSNWICSFRGPIGKDNDSTHGTDETMHMEMGSGAAASTGAVLSSLIASGAVAATVFCL